MRYAVEDRRYRRIFLTDREMASRILSGQAISDGSQKDDLPDDELRKLYGYVNNLRTMGTREANKSKPFNPLFMRLELMPLDRYAVSLKRLADWIAPLVLPAALLLIALVLWVGAQSGWRILDAGKSAFSLAGIATFAVVSPILKIPHELGHALTARRARVDLGTFGVLVIGLFPLPFVDCSMADVQANRMQRIRISLAGVFVDLMIAGLAFLAWHFVQGQFLQTLFLNIFVFSSLNSLLFNGNPLIKLDGYYAFSDAIGMRNLATRASRVYKRRSRFVTTFGKDGVWLRGKGQNLLSFYALASTFYKINILVTVFWVVLPRFFGLGAVLTLWGAYAMFLSPMLAKSSSPLPKVEKKSSSGPFWAIVAVILAGLAFVPLPVVVTAPAQLDTEGSYKIIATESGYLEEIHAGPIELGGQIARFGNPLLEQEMAASQAEVALLEFAYDGAQSSSPTEARMLLEQIEQTQENASTLSLRLDALDVLASSQGFVTADLALYHGSFVAPGDRLGYLIPKAETAILTAPFPERKIEQFRSATPTIQGRIESGEVIDISPDKLKLVQSLTVDQETGQRSYSVRADVPAAPLDLMGRTVWLRIGLGSKPLYSHVYDRLLDLRAAYRSALLASVN